MTIGLVGTSSLLIAKSDENDQKTPRISGAEPEEIRSSKYLRRAQSDHFLYPYLQGFWENLQSSMRTVNCICRRTNW
jgi:hypothetical protein